MELVLRHREADDEERRNACEGVLFSELLYVPGTRYSTVSQWVIRLAHPRGRMPDSVSSKTWRAHTTIIIVLEIEVIN